METEHGAELTAGLRKLLEAKDCIVRAGLTDDMSLAKVIRQIWLVWESKLVPKDGFSSADEIRSILQKAGSNVSARRIQEALVKVGVPMDGDHRFDVTDLKRMLERAD